MSVLINKNDKTYTLYTNSSMYQMKVDGKGVLLHTYYGKRLAYSDMSYALHRNVYAFSPVSSDFGIYDRWEDMYSLCNISQEISTFGNGDYRGSALNIRFPDGTLGFEPRFVSASIEKGKYKIPGLPAFYGDNADTLIITLKDKVHDVYAHLYYGVFEEYDLITRSVRIENKTSEAIRIEKALSMTLDFPYGKYDLVTFHGRHAEERLLERNHIMYGTNSISSTRGASGAMQNPFAVICDEDADEDNGNVWGLALVYSGSFEINASKHQLNDVRVTVGINHENFNFEVLPNDVFCTPEVAMVYSDEGFDKMSRCYHKAIRNNLCRGKYKLARRPVLINNWEGTYFNFNGDKLVAMAKDAKELGVELFVMDDGWFGKRDDDRSGLGDWSPNEKKLGCTLAELANRINDVGLKFGIWFEPECISEDSDLFRAHPDYAFRMPGRSPSRTRNELVLDMSRKEVRDNIYDQISKILREVNVSYVKWDFNSNICNVYSADLPASRQGEVYHRYMLGVYELLERITTEFPDVLFESCSGGGGRFDCGMLYYMPQVWTSDDTDPIERLKIQYGTSFAYPVSTMGAHVSASPNHQSSRETPLKTRGAVAYFGTYGLELDVTKMTHEEKEEIKRQIVEFKEHYDLIQNGEYHRLISPFSQDSNYCVWEVSSSDGKEALVCSVRNKIEANYNISEVVKLKGLIPEKYYTINGGKEKYLGGALMELGMPLKFDFILYPANIYHLTVCD